MNAEHYQPTVVTMTLEELRRGPVAKEYTPGKSFVFEQGVEYLILYSKQLNDVYRNDYSLEVFCYDPTVTDIILIDPEAFRANPDIVPRGYSMYTSTSVYIYYRQKPRKEII